MTRTNKLLLDTHVFLWWRSKVSRLSEKGRNVITKADVVFISAASAWEVSIKKSIGRLRIPETFSIGVEKSKFKTLPVLFPHAERVAELPLHHRDPFDRLLVAQALVENLTLITHDRALEAYDVNLIRV